MRSAIIIGTGGHSRVIFSIIKRCKTHEIKVFVDLNEDPIDDQMLGIPICGYKDFTRYVNDYELPDFYLAIDVIGNIIENGVFPKVIIGTDFSLDIKYLKEF